MSAAAAMVLIAGIGLNLLALASGDLPVYLKRIWRNRDRLSIDRSAALFLGAAGATYVQFIREYIPEDSLVVLAPGYPTGHEGIMEYFLLPRKVAACEAPYEQCAKAHQGPATFVLATRGYSLADPESLGYVFVPFAGKNWEFQGLYAPLGTAHAITAPLRPSARELVGEGLEGIALVLSLGLIGLWVGLALGGAGRPFQVLALAFPLGAGLVTFTLFLLSWAGLPLDPWLLLMVLMGWLVPGIVGWRRGIWDWASRIVRSVAGARHVWGAREIALLLFLVAVVALSVGMAVGLSYFEDDELAIWSTKGYGMVLEASVQGGVEWGAHGLAYPLNVPLQIGLFRLVSEDWIPISKLLFPLYFGCLLLGIADFLSRGGIRRVHVLLAVALLAVVPLLQFHSILGLANLPLSVYLVLGSLLAVDAIGGDSPGMYTLSGAMLALGAWTRAEAVIYAVSLIAILAVLGRVYPADRRRFLLRWIAPLLLVSCLWLGFAHGSVASSHLGEAVGAFSESVEAERVSLSPFGTLLAAFSATALHKERWGALLPALGILALLALVGGWRKAEADRGWLLVAGLVLTLEVVAIFFIRSYSRADFAILVSRAIHRHLMPAFLLLFVGVGMTALPRDTVAAARTTTPAGTADGSN
jgi:hypothetical protein